jgi:glycosyltransferase involved in cell wall biosynthesis
VRIALDVTSCVKTKRRGIASYGWELASALGRSGADVEIDLVVRQNRWLRRGLVRDMLPGARIRLGFPGLEALMLRDLDVLHGVGVRLPRRGAFGRVVTIHDLNVFEFPEQATEVWRATRSRRIRQTVVRADLLVVLSEQGAASLETHLHVPRERIRVVPHGVDVERFSAADPSRVAETLERLGIGEGPFVLSMGKFIQRKNHTGLLEAFARADLPEPWRLVLVGPRASDLGPLRPELARLGLDLARRVKTLDWIADDDLPAVLTGAAIYACPSLHEGFGMPVLEAQACGTPVLASNRGALPETVGDVGVVFDPEVMDDFVASLTRLASDAALRERYRKLGPERVRSGYSWEGVARAMLAVYREAAP